jgi:phage/plasmid-associated DNA primase
MRDLKGKRYSSLKTAFLYRKKYVKGANCKPKPWSAEAKAVHKKYAILDAEKKRRMHIAQSKRAENLRVAALTSKKKYRRLKAKYARTLNTAVKRARRSRKAQYRKKSKYRRKVARIYKRKKVYRPKKYKYKKYSFKYHDDDDW